MLRPRSYPVYNDVAAATAVAVSFLEQYQEPLLTSSVVPSINTAIRHVSYPGGR